MMVYVIRARSGKLEIGNFCAVWAPCGLRAGSVRVSISTLLRLGKKARSSLSVLHFL